MRTRLIVGNWKMNKTASEAAAFVRELVTQIPAESSVEVAIAPPFTALESARAALGSSPIRLGAQNLFWEDHGAYTGEVSAPMLRDLGCRYVILGHSERRTLFAERNDGVNRKIRAALKHGLNPILCVGETLTQREREATDEVLVEQLTGSLDGLTAHDMASVAVAYEPVWAIGTGKAATPAQATAAHRAIRDWVATGWSSAIANRTRILYGGSVTPENVESFLKSDQVDGALVGGACLRIESFAKIIAVAESLGA